MRIQVVIALVLLQLPLSFAAECPDGTTRIQTSFGSYCGVPPDGKLPPKPLKNQDIFSLMKAGLSSEIVVAKIKSSTCDFDTSPAALAELKSTSIPDAVILAMVQAPSKQEMRPLQTSVSQVPPAEPLPTAAYEKPIQRQSVNATQGLKLKILQEQSVPYTQTSGGGISTSCNIVGTANTSASASTFGNTTYGNATTNSNQHMSCNSYDTTIRWPHVLNVMFAEASDGNSYILACDRAWRWSKCVPLRAGEVFNARFTGKGIEVDAVNTKGNEEKPTYHILQSKSLR